MASNEKDCSDLRSIEANEGRMSSGSSGRKLEQVPDTTKNYSQPNKQSSPTNW